ncbi:hypothetical protein RSJ44_003000 [Yersinia enterocolitica]|uniref:hypothetical protein n=1 Tax=Yersinia enterocolitica TaxID=630 RepID=UPI0028B4228E|nr:hypothetical protein [Yersinia enterocolitica]EKN3983609.1 hypothetical protein [Yersinia enterocolitica]EKN5941863.1 hypothetical protein [Yersinia enterocolitica]EKN6225380.1 hypothetical protein [Yersinia enterocolitica]ELI8406321.1 hypothetical protein [Yersinia enterocolitica]
MDNWLYTEVIKEDDLRAPIFAWQSTINWMRALRFEIINEHGYSTQEQFESCVSHFKAKYPKKLSPLNNSFIFESLYKSLTGSLALQTSAKNSTEESWMLPGAIVTWYYSVYFSFLSMFGSTGQSVDDNHASVYRAFASNLCDQMPHPFNMKATHLNNEKYNPLLPGYSSAQGFSLSKTFPENDSAAKGMILEYLSGNAKYYTWLTKERILKKSDYKDFRTKIAKEDRNKQLPKTIAFMHCAFRYRGKANYRDGIYLTYGSASADETKAFLEDMKVVSQFAFISALALVYRSPLKPEVTNFLADIDKNLKGINCMTDGECFWRVL